MHLLFDLDGTLTDPFVGITTCIRYAVEGLGRTAPTAESLRWCIGPPLKGSFARLLDTRDEQLLNAAVAKYRERFSSEGLFENELYPGIADTLGQLKKDGHRLSVATSKPWVYAVRIVEHFSLEKYFRSVDGSELDGTRVDKVDLIAHILQRDGLAVEDVVMMGRYGHMGMMRRPKAVDHEAVANALARVNMSEFRKRQIGELSGGQKKRVFLARALAQDGRVILLDEPFTGVDVKTEEQIITLLRELRDEGRVMLVSTHNLGSVPEFCDRTILIKGTVLANGMTAETFTQKNLEKTFGGVLRHFVLNGPQGEASASIGVISDDERPLILQGGKTAIRNSGDGEGGQE